MNPWDFEKPRDFGKNQYELSRAQVVPEVCDMEPGDVSYVDFDELWADHDRKYWINSNANVFESMDELANYLNYVTPVRIIRINQGYIIDASHFDMTDYDDIEKRIARASLSSIERDDPDVEPAPVIWAALNDSELDVIHEKLAEFHNIVLDKDELRDFLDLHAALPWADSEHDEES